MMTRPDRLRRRAVAALAAIGIAAAVAGASPALAVAATHAGLLARYQPVTYLAPGERFAPVPVQTFVRQAALETRDAGGGFVLADPSPRATRLPTHATRLCRMHDLAPCWRLDQRTCSPLDAIGGLECYAAAFPTPRRTVVYGRVAPIGRAIVLQYWYFYADDVYSYQVPPSDFIWQAHEGDWEVVNVVLSHRRRPVEVGYSQHCSGRRRAWADAPRFRGTHPVVYVALGSHANELSPGAHAIDPQCLPPQALALLEQNGLPAPVDVAAAGSLAGPPAAGGSPTAIRVVTRVRPRWMRYPGAWGELEVLHAPAPIGTAVAGLGPLGPTSHDVWRRPLQTIASWPVG